jgi:methylglutaconyl-CoA hydratase
MAAFTYLQHHRDGAVEHLALNRPEVRNAFNEPLIDEMTQWAQSLAHDETVRAVVLSGAGPVFCAGADLQWMSRMVEYSREENLRDATAAARMFAALDALPVPLIARIHGAALGGGAGLAAVADIAIADERATFGFTEVKIGLLPAVIAPYVVGRIGQSAARDLFLTGRRFSAAHAREIGLVHEVAAADQLDAAVQRYLDEILGGGREAIAAAKALLRKIARHSLEDVIPDTVDAIAERRVSKEAQELMAKFLKRSRT